MIWVSVAQIKKFKLLCLPILAAYLRVKRLLLKK
jgi:hypothetical protein